MERPRRILDNLLGWLSLVLLLAVLFWATFSFLQERAQDAAISDPPPEVVLVSPKPDAGVLDLMLLFVGGLAAVLAAFVAALPFLTDKREEIIQAHPGMVKAIMSFRATMQTQMAKLIYPKSTEQPPIIRIDFPKASERQRTLPIRDIEGKLLHTDDVPYLDERVEKKGPEPEPEYISQSPTEIGRKYQTKLENLELYALAETKGGARLSGNGSLKFVVGRYFDFYRTCEVPVWNVAEHIVHKYLDFYHFGPMSLWKWFFNAEARRSLRSRERPAKLPALVRKGLKERKLKEKIEGLRDRMTKNERITDRVLGMGIVTMLIFDVPNGRPQFLLLRRSGERALGESIGMTSVTPAGSYAPTTIAKQRDEQTIAYNVARELGEELLGLRVDRCNPKNLPALPKAGDDHREKSKLECPCCHCKRDECKRGEDYLSTVKKLHDLLKEDKDAKLRYLGLGLDILSGKPNLLTALILQSKVLSDKESPLYFKNWRNDSEGVFENHPFKKSHLKHLLIEHSKHRENFSPSGYGALAQAYELFDHIYLDISSSSGRKIETSASLGGWIRSFGRYQAATRARGSQPDRHHEEIESIVARLNGIQLLDLRVLHWAIRPLAGSA